MFEEVYVPIIPKFQLLIFKIYKKPVQENLFSFRIKRFSRNGKKLKKFVIPFHFLYLLHPDSQAAPLQKEPPSVVSDSA